LINGKHYDRLYNDTIEPATTPLSGEAEKAFRAAFLAGAREVAEWDSPDVKAVAAAREAREKARHKAEVIVTSSQLFNDSSFDAFDPPGMHSVYRLGHEIEASRTRGGHHAMEFCLRDWQELKDLRFGNNEEIRREFMRPWLEAVATWATAEPDGLWPPPRPLDDFTPTQWRAVLSKQDGHECIHDSIEDVEVDLGRRYGCWSLSWNCRSTTGEAVGRVYRWWRQLGDVVRLAVRRGERWVVFDGTAENTMTHPPLSAPSLGNRITPPSPPRIRLTRADQIEMRSPQWLLRGTLERNTFALIFGDPGCGKSFLAIDWACRVATGTPCRGHRRNTSTAPRIASAKRPRKKPHWRRSRRSLQTCNVKRHRSAIRCSFRDPSVG
jgi:hypothetical protein